MKLETLAILAVPVALVVLLMGSTEISQIEAGGGLTSGIDMALRVVERYFGTEIAQRTADYMEYQSTGWQSDTLVAAN